MKNRKTLGYFKRLYYRFIRKLYRWSLKQVRKHDLLMMIEQMFYRTPDRVLSIHDEKYDGENISFDICNDTYALILPISSEEDKTRTYLVKKLKD